jgi:predicted kinase
MPQSEFALPGGRYPVEDKNHARNALARASQQLHKGNLTIAEAEKIRRKAKRKLGE